MVKIVKFQGGIGNQLFQYCLIDYLKRRGKTVYYVDEIHGHNGLEIHKYFDVNLTPLPKFLYKIYKRTQIRYPKIFRHYSTLKDVFDIRKVVFDGYWQDKKYRRDGLDIVFKDLDMSQQNAFIMKKMQSYPSVSIHARRGDYLRYPQIYGGACTVEYYMKAIAYIESKVAHPVFYVFSDDIEWCKHNLTIPNAQYVNWNRGRDSIFDMYLMSKCKANIIANSTFSYWGAVIAKNNIVVYPQKWFANRQQPDIFDSSWVGI